MTVQLSQPYNIEIDVLDIFYHTHLIMKSIPTNDSARLSGRDTDTLLKSAPT